jgi:hypothetical protein
MHLDLQVGGFSGSYAHLNSLAKIRARWLAIARHMVSLEAEHTRFGSADWFLARNQAFHATLQLFHFNLMPRRGFLWKPQTRLGMASNVAGEAFTRAFAYGNLKASRVYQLDCALGITKNYGHTAAKVKPGGSISDKIGHRHRPDFVAVTAAGFHLLEAKGASSRHCVSIGTVERQLADGLVQVSRIRELNGRSPVTRTACSFAFDRRGSWGSVWDPPEDLESYDVEVDFPALVRRGYAAFLIEADIEEFGDGFVGVTLAPGIRFSVDRQILMQAREVRDMRDVDEFHFMLDRRRADLEHEGPTTSVGADGMRLDADMLEKVEHRPG